MLDDNEMMRRSIINEVVANEGDRIVNNIVYMSWVLYKYCRVVKRTSYELHHTGRTSTSFRFQAHYDLLLLLSGPRNGESEQVFDIDIVAPVHA